MKFYFSPCREPISLVTYTQNYLFPYWFRCYAFYILDSHIVLWNLLCSIGICVCFSPSIQFHIYCGFVIWVFFHIILAWVSKIAEKIDIVLFGVRFNFQLIWGDQIFYLLNGSHSKTCNFSQCIQIFFYPLIEFEYFFTESWSDFC